MMIRKVIIFTLLMVLPAVVYAEVSDKLPSMVRLWAQAIILGGLSFGASYVRWWVPLVFIPFTIVFGWGSAAIVTDPQIGPAVVAEQGRMDEVSAFGSAFIIFIGQGLGIWRGLKERQKLKSAT